MHPYGKKRVIEWDSSPNMKVVARATMMRAAIKDSMDEGGSDYDHNEWIDSVYCEVCEGPCSGLAIPFEGFEQ